MVALGLGDEIVVQNLKHGTLKMKMSSEGLKLNLMKLSLLLASNISIPREILTADSIGAENRIALFTLIMVQFLVSL